MINDFLIDLGNVLAPFDFERFHSGIEAAGGIVTEDRRGAHLTMRDAFESGTLSDQEFIEKSSRLFNYPGSADDFIRCWENIFTVNQPMLDVVAALRARDANLYLLSNTNNLHINYVQRSFDMLSHFDKHIYSFEVGCLKPEVEIYRIAATRCDIVPERTLFIDDLHNNIHAAAMEGFLTHTYEITAHENLLAQLAGLDVVIDA